MSAQPRLSKSSAATFLAAALVALPFLQALAFDFDRCGPLVLLLPAIWAGRVELAQALARIHAGPRWLKFLCGLSSLGVLVAVICSRQFAPGLVTAASWVLLAAAGLVAGQCVANDPTTGRRLLAGLALGTAAGTLTVWALWWLMGRSEVPLYPHPRILGLHTLAGAVASVALITQKDVHRAGRVFWLAAGVITWGGMFWSGGRAPVLALAVALGLWMLLSSAPMRRALFRTTVLLLLAGLVVSAAFWTSRPDLGWWHALGRTATAAGAGSASQLSSTRTEFWSAVVERAKGSPWIGHGPDSYRFLTPKLDGQQPHNVALQFWLDLGVVGAVPLLILLLALFVIGWRRAVQSASVTPLAWLAVLTASLVAGMLDGVFYHLLAFLPAMLAWGVALGLVSNLAPPARISNTPRAVIGLATIVLVVHMGVFYVLAVGPVPAPTDWRALGVRAFPSSTFGLWRWLDDWQETHPGDVLEWTRWAQEHSPNPVFFHVYAARVLAAQGDGKGAELELRTARDQAHWSMRPGIDAMLRQLHPVSP
jgi:O-antigen ligase